MALSQSIVWTTLPYGRITLPNGDSALRISVLVSPRLSPTAQEVLKPFNCFLDWPAVAATLKFKLVFDGGAGGELVPLRDDDPLDSSLWRRLFDEETFVRAHEFTDLKDEAIRSYPAADVAAYVQDIYGRTAEKHGAEFPAYGDDDDTPLSQLKRELGPLSNPAMRDRYNESIDQVLRKAKVVSPVQLRAAFLTAAAPFSFFQASRFFDRPKPAGKNPPSERPDPAFEPVPIPKPEFDFHQAISALADYPRLMRRLGLVLDFAWIERAPVPPQGRVRVELEWSNPRLRPAWHVTDLPAWTEYALSKTDFRARAGAKSNPELTRGQLDLRGVRDAQPDRKDGQAYVMAQLDVDGSALKTSNTAGTLARMEQPEVKNYRTPQTSDLPALRTAPLALYKRDRAIATHAQLIRAAQIQSQFSAATRVVFFADDLVRGYRFDIWNDVSEEWHPLCLRNGEYRFTKRGKFELELRDEGYVKSSSASRGEDGTPTDLYLHERLAAFDGWSLVASRPGRTLPKDPSDTEPEVPNEDAATEFGLTTRFFAPKGTIPRLRFGRRYRLRVRLVDVAGNSIAFETAGEDSASQPYLYCRYEPVPSPTLLLRARVTEGESLEHLVIRSDYDRTAEMYAADAGVNAILDDVRDRLELKGADRAAYVYLDRNERHVAPPKTSQLEAETHGRFDEFIGPGKDHAKGRRLALRESATFLSRTMVNLATGVEEKIPGLDLDTVPPAGEKRTNLNDPKRNPGDALQDGEYVLHREEQLTVPYLPDPFAAAVAFAGLPGVPTGDPFVVSLDGTWPSVRPFRLRLVERAGVLNECQQVFSDAGVPKWDAGERVLTVFQPKGVSTEVRYSSVLPSDAEAKQMGLWKWLEQRGGLGADTRKAILSGKHWMFTPWRTLTLVHAVQHPLCRPTITRFEADRSKGDTFAELSGKWHLSIKSTAKVDILAAWQEPLDDVAQQSWQMLERSGHAAELKMNPEFSDELEVPPGIGAFARRIAMPLRHEFGDTKHRVVRYRLKGTTRFREYFPVELTHDDEAITRVGDEFAVSVPSSARPIAPRPLYVLPTFRWEETPLPNGGLVRTRRGNGLRVYLERPWWSSGESERLGVVFKPGPIDQDGADKPYVTQWGLDPAFDSSAPIAGPTLAAFPLAVDTSASVNVEELGEGGDNFSVAGHQVEFDPVRKLWFADLVVQAGVSYFPFIRLALARFQPFSIPGFHLSRVVLTDFVQLVPDRTLDVRWIDANKVRVKIFGPAPTETFVSRILGSLRQVRTTAQTTAATAPVSDLLTERLSGANVMQAFKPGAIEALQEAGHVVLDPHLFAPAPSPAEPSKRPGLNEYGVTVERLPENESPDFGWMALDGVTVTKPPATTGGGTAVDPRSVVLETARGRTPFGSTKRAISAKRVTKLGSGESQFDELVNEGTLAALRNFLVVPLWEGDVTLPVANDGRPRRIVVRENELYFKATPQPREFLAVARRLVYVDIVDLPNPVA